MAFAKTALILAVTMLVLCGICIGATQTVGDSNGWTFLDYNEWASTKEFHVGDTPVFVYNNQFHHVMRVSDQDFESYNLDSAIAIYNSGHDIVTLERPGHFYFLCGTPGHCQAGQMVDVKVTQPILADDSDASPSPAPLGLSSPPSDSGAVATSSTQSSASNLWLSLILTLFWFVLW